MSPSLVAQVLAGLNAASEALDYFEKAYPVVSHVDADSRRPVHIMGAVYCAILQKIRRLGFPVFDRQVALTTVEKVRVVAQSFWRLGKGFDDER